MANLLYASLTRISDLPTRQWSLAPLPQHHWRDGDYVVGEVVDRPGALSTVELCDGRAEEALTGDLVVGAFGRRAATHISNDAAHLFILRELACRRSGSARSQLPMVGRSQRPGERHSVRRIVPIVADEAPRLSGTLHTFFICEPRNIHGFLPYQ